jgi:iron complex outermembrane receptor protein
VRQSIAASADRSSGFMYDRDFKTAIVRSRAALGTRSGVSLSYLWKEFGANNFYGGNAPSREWTNQTLLSADHRVGEVGGWSVDAQASYRTHGDRFVFNQLVPALSDNRHRTHAVLATASGARPLGRGSLTLGIEGGGDWIRSSNLGDHETSRVSAFGEWRQTIGPGVHLDALLRVDRYGEFGASANPSLGVGWWVNPTLRVRGSAARAFRVPTFTERYYSDPANLARADVGPETAWAGEGGLDAYLASGWLLQATFFGRADANVIDWLRPTPADRWQTYNVRDVGTLGVELSARKTLASGAFLLAQYTALDVDAAAVTQLSKYVLDYAPHSFTAAALIPLPARLRVAPRIEYRRRSRSAGTSDDVLLDARISRRINQRLDLFVEGTNLLDAAYQEIAGVAMPGAALRISIAISR